MEGAYVWVMVHYLPPSLRGLMLAGFAAAYMSTIGTHLNLGASYMINDIYKRFLAPGRTEHHYVAASRIATILVAVMSASATGYMLTHGDSIATAWKFLLALGAGAGLVFILRWYWWRINAWSRDRRHDRGRHHLAHAGKLASACPSSARCTASTPRLPWRR